MFTIGIDLIVIWNNFYGIAMKFGNVYHTIDELGEDDYKIFSRVTKVENGNAFGRWGCYPGQPLIITILQRFEY